MYDYGVYSETIIFNIPFNLTIPYDLDHLLITINHNIIDEFECSYEVIYIVGHAGGDMIVHSNE